MRSIRLASLDKVRPVLVLTREGMLPFVTQVSVAPVTSRIRGLSTEVAVGRENGLDHDSVISCDNITTIHVRQLGDELGLLLPHQEAELAEAIATAFDLEVN